MKLLLIVIASLVYLGFVAAYIKYSTSDSKALDDQIAHQNKENQRMLDDLERKVNVQHLGSRIAKERELMKTGSIMGYRLAQKGYDPRNTYEWMAHMEKSFSIMEDGQPKAGERSADYILNLPDKTP